MYVVRCSAHAHAHTSHTHIEHRHVSYIYRHIATNNKQRRKIEQIETYAARRYEMKVSLNDDPSRMLLFLHCELPLPRKQHKKNMLHYIKLILICAVDS